MQIIFEMGDRFFVREDRFADDVVDLDDAAKRLFIEYGQITDVLVR